MNELYLRFIWESVHAEIYPDPDFKSLTRLSICVRVKDERVRVLTMLPTKDLKNLEVYRHALNAMVDQVDEAILERIRNG